MKLRPRTQRPTDNSSTVTATVPVLPPNITRLQTPPISELSNAGSTIARKNRLSELSGTLFERSDTEETINSVSPTKNRTRPTITIPTAPLTKRNLAKHQEQIDSAVEVASEDERSPPPTTPNTRLVQARNFLLAENTGSYPDFATRLELIEHFLRDIPQEKEKSLSSIYYEVKDLLRVHRLHTIAGVEPSIQRRPHKEAFRPVMSLPAGDDLDPEKQADPFEWTNKLDDLTERVKKSPSGGKEALSSNIRELARPLHGGRLPSLQEAYCLINERVIKENHENKTPNEINHDRLWAFERTLQPASKERKFSLDRWSGHPPERSTVPAIKLGEGSLMPQEMMDIDWDRDRSRLEDSLEGHEDVDRGEAQLLLAETPLLQALMSEQIENDLAAST